MKAIVKFIVSAGYRKFEFDDAETALDFAMTAAEAMVETDRVEIEIVTEAEDDGLS